MISPDVRLQIAAVTLAEELNFTRAAERLSITQPALSKQISDLESQVGFAVFVRNHRQVELTDSGQIFIQGCRDSLAIMERTVRQARAMQDEAQPVITIGHSPYADPSLVAAILAVHLPSFPNLRLRMESMFAGDLSHAVLASELDIALIAEPADNPRLTRVQVAKHPLCAVMPSDHAAAAKHQVAIEDFAGIGWMVFARKSHPSIYERLMEEARFANVSPVELHHYLNPQEALPLISENFGVAFAAKGLAEQLRGMEIAVRPLSHPSLQILTYLVLRADENSRLVNEFGRIFLRKVAPQNNQQTALGQLQLSL